MRATVTMLSAILIAAGLSSTSLAASGGSAASAAKSAAKPAAVKPAASRAPAASAAPAAGKGSPVLNAQGKCVDSVTKRFVDSKLCAAKPAGGPGKGVKCGNSYIAAGKKCTKPG